MRPNTNSSDSDGNQESDSASRWMGWTLGLLTVPVVYVLSVPAVFMVEFKSSGRNYMFGGPKWLTVYMTPYVWLMENTPLQEPLKGYRDWWLSR